MPGSLLSGHCGEYMLEKRNNNGFTLVELIVVLAMLVTVLALSHNAFLVILSQVSAQSRLAQSNIQGIIGLELLRSDIVSAGYGLPWNPSDLNYNESDGNKPQNASDQKSGPPVAVQVGDNVDFKDDSVVLTGTDYLVLRATKLATNAAAQRWSAMTRQLTYNSVNDIVPNPPSIRLTDWQHVAPFAPSDWVTVLTGFEDSDPNNQRRLVTYTDTAVADTYANATAQNTPYAPPIPNLQIPPHPTSIDSAPYFVYGIKEKDSDADSAPRMPHNRADYFVSRPTRGTIKMPQRCAPKTGILFKGIISQKDGEMFPMLPLLDCVADFQVVFDIDPLNNGSIVEDDAASFSNRKLSAADIRNQLKNIKVYILTHDGKRDDNYTYPSSTVGVGPGDGRNSSTGSTFDFQKKMGAGSGWEHYRWKVYRIVVNPKNLLQDQK